jgi:hypothetical protein
MNRSLLCAVCLLAVAVSSMSVESAFADRRLGLGGNRLIEDRDDVFTYPQRILDYRNLIMFDYGAAQNSGNGVMLLGSEAMAFGVSVHRGDILTPDVIGLDSNLAWLADPTHPLLGAQAPYPGVGFVGGAGSDPLTMFDILFGMKAGPGAFGVRLGLGSNSEASKQPGVGEDAIGNFFLMGELGYSLKGSFRFDASLNFLYDGSKVVVGGQDTETSDVIRVAVSTRGFTPLDPKIDLGFIADLTFANQSHTTGINTDAKTVDTGLAFGLQGGIGPVYKVNESTTIAGYAVVGLGFRNGDPNNQTDQDGYSGTSFVFPGFRMAFETALTQWLYVRSGLQYTYIFLSGTQQTPNGDQEASSRRADFGWNAGMGIKLDAFFFDGAFQHSFLTTGPDFIGGGGSGMFTMVSAGYRF